MPYVGVVGLKRGAESGLRALAKSLLSDALNRLTTNRHGEYDSPALEPGGYHQQTCGCQGCALEWIYGHLGNGGQGGSFEWCCSALELDPVAAAEGIARNRLPNNLPEPLLQAAQRHLCRVGGRWPAVLAVRVTQV